ncbi:MAG: hypothetical protein NZ519_05075 [Bacteroidia bacterium]|nr:hypothetical protein [Bacteroidia bacterium]
MDWVNTETLKNVLQVSGVSGLLAFSLFGLIKVFSAAFAKKDERFIESITNTNNQFMQFIERERLQHNTITQKMIETLVIIQQELNNNIELYKKQITVIDKLVETVSNLEHRTEVYFSEVKAQHEELKMQIKMLGKTNQ